MNGEYIMAYNLSDVLIRLGESISVVYLIDLEEKRYSTLKDNKHFHDAFGSEGLYIDLMNGFFERSVDSKVSKDTPYGRFSILENDYTGDLAKIARMEFAGSYIYVSITTCELDNRYKAILITEISEKHYNNEINIDQKINALRSAYLFSMNVDLLEDNCESMSMSEIDVTPANSPKMQYSVWRTMILDMFLPEDRALFNKITDPEYLKHNLSYQKSKSIDMQMKNLEGVFIWVKLIFHRINTGNDDDFKMLFMVEDIHDSHTRLVEDLNKFEFKAKHDDLTGLLCRDAIDSEINARVKKCRSEDKPITLLMFDIDYFKQVNDNFGHSTGDVVLKGISDLANKQIAECGGILGRWGGEEFIGVFEDADKEKVKDIAEGVRNTVAEHNFENVGKVTISIGVSKVNAHDTVETAFERIDAALYKAKNEGRNRVCVS
ncbi:diguanylate cyclase (GGDEF) domain-containing protein [Lachnospiraceae bacterium]|nr:diguanylate cyclase (GGDEF) domain-containing protein [Lachnospiraceae bacterium]